MKKLLSLATAGIIGTATICSTAQAGQLTTADKEFLFNNPSVAKAETLSPEEMKNTEGAWGWWGAIMGGLAGGAGYIGTALGSGTWDWGWFASSVIGGAIAGATLWTPTAMDVAYSFGAGLATGYTYNLGHHIAQEFGWDW
jgi:hypothetical protein